MAPVRDLRVLARLILATTVTLTGLSACQTGSGSGRPRSAGSTTSMVPLPGVPTTVTGLTDGWGQVKNAVAIAGDGFWTPDDTFGALPNGLQFVQYFPTGPVATVYLYRCSSAQAAVAAVNRWDNGEIRTNNVSSDWKVYTLGDAVIAVPVVAVRVGTPDPYFATPGVVAAIASVPNLKAWD